MKISVSIPEGTNCLLKLGQNVDFTTPFYQKSEKSTRQINIAEKLDIAPKKIFSYLSKLVGDTIKEKEIIAQKKDLFATKTVISDVDGVISEIDHTTGKIVVQEEAKQNTAMCYFRGQVLKLDKEKVIIDLINPKTFQLKSANRDFGGKVYYAKQEESLILANSSLIDGRIVFCESLSLFSQTKIEALGASGFVTLKKIELGKDMAYAQLKFIEDYKKILASDLPYCLVDKESSKINFYQ